MPFILKTVVEALSVSDHQCVGARQRRHLSQTDQHRHRRRARLGLIVPVIKGADNLSLTGLTRALTRQSARTKRLDPREVKDGTF
jgi:pyruvate/2-oxoglutarate dehydrogenase complex dihydrolipoamide acyltransferase (E2) component